MCYITMKNVKNFEENKKVFDGINFSDKKSNADIGFNFLEKKVVILMTAKR